MKSLKIWIWVMAVLMIIIIGLYFNNFFWKLFNFNRLSNSKEDWGTFGDYLSGVFAIFNLGVIIILAVYVNYKEENRIETETERDNKRNVQELQFQKERSDNELKVQKKILLTQLRVNYLQDFNINFSELAKIEVDIHKAAEKITLLQYQLLNIGIRMDYLFKGINKNEMSILGKELSKQLILFRDVLAGKNQENILEYYSTNFADLLDAKNNFSTLIETYIFNDLDN